MCREKRTGRAAPKLPGLLHIREEVRMFKSSRGAKKRTSFPETPDPRRWWSAAYDHLNPTRPETRPPRPLTEVEAAHLAVLAAEQERATQGPMRGRLYAAEAATISHSFEAEQDLIEFLTWYKKYINDIEGVRLLEAARKIVFLRAQYAPEFDARRR